MKTTEIEKAALRLSSRERAALSYKLLESIDAESFTADADELRQKEVDERYKQLTTGIAKDKEAELVIKRS